jgi:hypothetical protein
MDVYIWFIDREVQEIITLMRWTLLHYIYQVVFWHNGYFTRKFRRRIIAEC